MQHEDTDDIGTIEDMAAVMLKTAQELHEDAHDLYQIGIKKNRMTSFKSTVNRSYYAAFSAISALHTLDGRHFKRHGQAIGAFNYRTNFNY